VTTNSKQSAHGNQDILFDFDLFGSSSRPDACHFRHRMRQQWAPAGNCRGKLPKSFTSSIMTIPFRSIQQTQVFPAYVDSAPEAKSINVTPVSR